MRSELWTIFTLLTGANHCATGLPCYSSKINQVNQIKAKVVIKSLHEEKDREAYSRSCAASLLDLPSHFYNLKIKKYFIF